MKLNFILFCFLINLYVGAIFELEFHNCSYFFFARAVISDYKDNIISFKIPKQNPNIYSNTVFERRLSENDKKDKDFNTFEIHNPEIRENNYPKFISIREKDNYFFYVKIFPAFNDPDYLLLIDQTIRENNKSYIDKLIEGNDDKKLKIFSTPQIQINDLGNNIPKRRLKNK
jgi:hypothetical protein